MKANLQKTILLYLEANKILGEYTGLIRGLIREDISTQLKSTLIDIMVELEEKKLPNPFEEDCCGDKCCETKHEANVR